MPYPTVVLDEDATKDRINQFRDFSKSLPDPAQAQIDADLAAYKAHVAQLGDVVPPSSPSTSTGAVSPAAPSATGSGLPAVGDVNGWRQWLVGQAGAAGKDPDFINAVLSGAYAESGLDPNRRQAGGNGRGFFQFGTGGGMGTGLSDAQLYDPAYQASKILPRYLDAWQRAPQGLSGADKAAWVAVQAERPDDSRGQASANYRAAYNQVMSNVGQSDQSGAGTQAAGILPAAPPSSRSTSAGGAPSLASPSGQDSTDATGSTGIGSASAVLGQPSTPNDDLKAFSAYTQGLGDPGGTSTFGQNPEDATSPIDQARNQGQTGLPDFSGMASSALSTAGGFVSSMLPKAPASQGFSLGSQSQEYNDMAGAPGGFSMATRTPANPSTPFGVNPQDASSPIDRARDSGQGFQLLGGDQPISGPINATGIPQAVQANLDRRSLAFTAPPSPEQQQAFNVTGTDLFPMAGIEAEGARLAKPLLEGAGGAIKAGVTRMFHGSQSVAPSIDPAKFLPGIEHESNWGPMFYASPNPEVANRFAPTPGQITATAGGAANVRAVNIPNDLKLFDADANRAALAKMYADAGGDRQAVIDQLVAQGYEGMTSANAQQVGIFPHALPKVTNALSGAPEGAAIGRGGSPPSAPSGQIPTPENPNARAGNILLKKYVPEEVQQVISDTFAANPTAAEAARRGVVSDATVRELADAAGTTVQKVVDRWKPGDAANAESILSMRQALSAKSQEVLDAQKAVQGGNTTANLLTLQLKLKEQQAIQQAVSGVSAEAGRALRQFRQEVDGAIGSQDSRMMEALLKKLGGREWTEELSQRLGQLPPDDPTATFKFIRDLAKSTVNDKLTEFWYNAILSAPTTHLSNLISNTVSAVLSPVETALAGAIDKPLAALQHRPQGRFIGEARPEVVGMLQGFPEGVQKALYTMKNGFSLDDAVRLDLRRTQAIRGPVGDVINTPSRLLAAADTMGQAVLYSAKKNALAFRTAASEGLKGKALADRAAFLSLNPTPAMMTEAGKLAEYRLFRQEPGKVTQGLIDLRNAQVFGATPIRYVLPFIQTPVNLFKFGLERSPLGWFNPALWGKTGAIARHDPAAADMFARAFMGSMVSAAIAAKFGSGEITGAAPTSPGERDAFYRQGKQPYSMRIGDQWISYQKMEPFNQDFMMIAGVVDAIRDGKAGTDPTSAAIKIGTTVAKGLVSQTYLSGLSDALDALNDPDRYGAKFAQRFVGSLVPFSSLGRSVVRATDPTVRSPDTMLDAVKANIPGLSQQVPSKLNAFGQESVKEGSPLSPYNVSSAKTSNVESELARLRIEPGFVGNSAHGIDLTPAEHRQYQQQSGQLMEKKLTDYIGSSEWQGDNDAQRGKTIRRLIQQARDRVGHDILDALPPAEYQRRKAGQAVGAR